MSARHAIAFVAVLVAAGLIAGCGDDSDDTTTMELIEHAETDVVRHVGPPKEEDSTGDILTFANPVFDSSNKEQVGSDNGTCIRTAAGKAWECIWTLTLDEGQITVEGPFYDGKDSVLAITGGTDEFKGAGGQMKLHSRNPDETEYDFTYEIED